MLVRSWKRPICRFLPIWRRVSPTHRMASQRRSASPRQPASSAARSEDFSGDPQRPLYEHGPRYGNGWPAAEAAHKLGFLLTLTGRAEELSARQSRL